MARPLVVDSIGDFDAADDTIRLNHLVFTGTVLGTLAAAAFVEGRAALESNDRVLYDAATGALWYDLLAQGRRWRCSSRRGRSGLV